MAAARRRGRGRRRRRTTSRRRSVAEDPRRPARPPRACRSSRVASATRTTSPSSRSVGACLAAYSWTDVELRAAARVIAGRADPRGQAAGGRAAGRRPGAGAVPDRLRPVVLDVRRTPGAPPPTGPKPPCTPGVRPPRRVTLRRVSGGLPCLRGTGRRRVGAVCAASLALTLVACQGSPHPGSGGPVAGGRPVAVGVRGGVPRRGRVQLARGATRSPRCRAAASGRWRGSPRATTARRRTGRCARRRTDFVLHLSEDRPPPVGSDGTAAGEIPQGYACMRNLEPPHPGDPGAAAGPARSSGTACTRRAAARSARPPATAPARRSPEYRVAAGGESTAPSALRSRPCYVTLGGSEPVGCARPGVVRRVRVVRSDRAGSRTPRASA